MLDHIGLKVRDLHHARAFYDKTLAALGITVQMHVSKEMTGDGTEHLGYGVPEKPFFWLSQAGAAQTGIHIAFAADNRQAVDAFHAAAMAAGGKDNGQPGLRPHYHADYYGAFVLDPDGNNVEAVCHRPEQG